MLLEANVDGKGRESTNQFYPVRHYRISTLAERTAQVSIRHDPSLFAYLGTLGGPMYLSAAFTITDKIETTIQNLVTNKAIDNYYLWDANVMFFAVCGSARILDPDFFQPGSLISELGSYKKGGKK
jgi:hypothetical protein